MTAHEAKDVIEITAVNKVKKHIHNGAITVKFTGNGDLNFSYPQRNISVYDDRQASDYIQELLAHQVTDIVVLFASDDMAIKHTIAATVLFEKNGLDTVVWATL